MEVKKCRVASLVLLLIILVSQEMLCQGLSGWCESKSKIYKGKCKDSRCRIVCWEQGFAAGICKRKWVYLFDRKCTCGESCTDKPKDMIPANLRTMGLRM